MEEKQRAIAEWPRAALACQLSDTPDPTHAEDARVMENDIQLSKEKLPQNVKYSSYKQAVQNPRT